MNREETKLCREFLRVVGCWHCRIEYAPGGTAGNPDVMVLVDGRLVPIEFKIAKPVSDRYSVQLRPSQAQWHSSFREAGGVSLLVAGTADQELVWIKPVATNYELWPDSAVSSDLWFDRLRKLTGRSASAMGVDRVACVAMVGAV